MRWCRKYNWFIPFFLRFSDLSDTFLFHSRGQRREYDLTTACRWNSNVCDQLASTSLGMCSGHSLQLNLLQWNIKRKSAKCSYLRWNISNSSWVFQAQKRRGPFHGGKPAMTLPETAIHNCVYFFRAVLSISALLCSWCQLPLLPQGPDHQHGPPFPYARIRMWIRLLKE